MSTNGSFNLNALANGYSPAERPDINFPLMETVETDLQMLSDSDNLLIVISILKVLTGLESDIVTYVQDVSAPGVGLEEALYYLQKAATLRP